MKSSFESSAGWHRHDDAVDTATPFQQSARCFSRISKRRPCESPEAESARLCLAQSGYAPLTHVKCDSNEGVLVLEGRVPTYYLKQLAQTFVRDVPGVDVVVNNVQVHSNNG